MQHVMNYTFPIAEFIQHNDNDRSVFKIQEWQKDELGVAYEK